MIPLLPRWNLRPDRASFYDTDSATLLELASTLHSTMNSLIEHYNQFVDRVNTLIAEFMQSETQKREVFEVAIRQEFQDFIDIVNLKMDNLPKFVEDLIHNAIASGEIKIVQQYNSETESLELVVTEEV